MSRGLLILVLALQVFSLVLPAGVEAGETPAKGYLVSGSSGAYLPDPSRPRPDVDMAQALGPVLDVRYVDQIYAQGHPECWPGGGCFWNDCGPAAAAMVLHYEGLERRDVLTNRRATLDLVCEAKSGCRGTTNRERMVATLMAHGLDVYTADRPALADVVASIDRGHPVILSLAPRPDHLMLAVGHKPGGIVVVHDPYGGAFWWNYPGRANLPRGTAPKRNGEAVEYRYADLEPAVVYGVFVAGVAPVSTGRELFSAN